MRRLGPRLLLAALVTAAVLTLTAAPARCEDEKGTVPPIVDPQAQQVIDQFGRYIANLKVYAVQIESQIKVSAADKPITFDGMDRILVERPAKLVFSGKPGYGLTVLRCDGVSVATYFVKFKEYVIGPAPKSCEGLIATLRELKLSHPAIGSVVTGALLADDPARLLLSTAESVHYRGTEMLDGVECHLLHAVDKEMDWQMWIDVGDQPLVRQLVPDISKEAAKLPPLADGELTSVVRFRWKLDPVVKSNHFNFQIPEEATEANSFADVVGIEQLRSARDAPAP